VRILHVWRRPYPFDIRVDKISRTLAQDGHEVHILAANAGNEPTLERENGLTIHRLPALRGVPRSVSRATTYPTAWNPRWLRALLEACTRTRPEVLLVRDVQLALPCLAIRSALHIPLVLDLPEHWPAVISIWRQTEGLCLRNLFTRSVAMFTAAERIAALHADHVLVCVEEMVDRMVRIGVPRDRVHLVRNTPDLVAYPRLDSGQALRAARIRAALESRFVVAYAGELDLFRGIDVLLRAIARLRQQIPSIRLLCIGPGKPRNLDVLHELCRELDLGNNVSFTGWLDQQVMLDHLAASDVCVAPFHRCEHIDHTLSNKIFDYMSLGKPFVATEAVPICRLLSEVKCGIAVQSRDVGALEQALRSLLDPIRRERLGREGLRAVREQYNWQLTDGPTLARLFQHIAATRLATEDRSRIGTRPHLERRC